jgi:hypothetical protein
LHYICIGAICAFFAIDETVCGIAAVVAAGFAPDHCPAGSAVVELMFSLDHLHCSKK